MKSVVRFFLLFFLTLFLSCGGGNSGGDSQQGASPDPKENISESVRQYLSLWAEAMLAENTNSLTALISTDYMNYGLGYASRASALEDVLNQIDITSYSLELVSVESYDGVNAKIKIRTIYTYDWLLSPGCSPSVDRTSTSHITGDGAGGWLSTGNQDSSYVPPSNDGFNAGTGSTVAKCVDFNDRVTGKKNTFGPDDYAIYAMYHVKNVLGPSLGSYEWVRPDGSIHKTKKFAFKAKSNRYSGWSVAATLPVKRSVNLFNKYQGEWKLVGHVKGKNGSADFSNSVYYSASSTSKKSRSSKLIVDEADDPLPYSLIQNGPILR